jgi:hypothetical protein
MMRFSPAHAALLGASIIVACSSTSQTATQQATPAPVPATPTYPPIPSMSQIQQANCAQPGANVTYYDAKTGQPIVIGSNEYIQFTLPLGSSIATATAWVIAQVNNHSQRRIAYPRAPMIVGEISQSIHSASTIEVLPYYTQAYKQLVDDYIRHIVYTAFLANQARQAQITAINTGKLPVIPTPNPTQSAQEAYYQKVEASPIAGITEGTPPDDSDFQDSPGDPDSQDPHMYDFFCKFVANQPYTLIWREETRYQQTTTVAFGKVQNTLTKNNASAGVKGNVGWVADQFLTFVAKNVQPELVPPAMIVSPSPGADASALPSPFPSIFGTPIAAIDLKPLPTPGPSQTPPPGGGAAPTAPAAGGGGLFVGTPTPTPAAAGGAPT